jgi:hypothetical protein
MTAHADRPEPGTEALVERLAEAIGRDPLPCRCGGCPSRPWREDAARRVLPIIEAEREAAAREALAGATVEWGVQVGSRLQVESSEDKARETARFNRDVLRTEAYVVTRRLGPWQPAPAPERDQPRGGDGA